MGVIKSQGGRRGKGGRQSDQTEDCFFLSILKKGKRNHSPLLFENRLIRDELSGGRWRKMKKREK
jgi:hypothetical protein